MPDGKAGLRRFYTKKGPTGEPWDLLKFLIRQESSAFFLSTVDSPSLYNVLLGLLAEGLNGRLFGDFFGTISYDSYLLSSCFFALLDRDGFETWQCTERRTDVTLTSASDYAGHAGNIGDVFSHCCWSKSKNRQRHGCDKFFHSIVFCETGIRQPRH